MKEEKLGEEKGITLIALVITVIVLLILAGVTIATLTGENGILTKANIAKIKTDNSAEYEKLELAIIGSYGVNGEIDLGDLKRNLTEQGILYTDTDSFPLEVILNGRIITINEDGTIEEYESLNGNWKQNGTIVTNEVTKQTLEVGDVVNYQASVENYDGGWKILGAENGSLLIMSTKNIANEEDFFGNTGICFESYNKALEHMNTICKPFENGKNVLNARPVTLNDINKLTGYNPENIDGNGTPCRKDTVSQYKTKVVFSYDKDGYICYTSDNGLSGKFSKSKNVFETAEGKNLKDEGTIEIQNTGYIYTGKEYLDENSKAYKMLFRNSEDSSNSSYCLGNQFVNVWQCYNNHDESWLSASYGVQYIKDGKIDQFGIMSSTSSAEKPEIYILDAQELRVVISLDSNVKIKGNSSNGWTIEV